MGNYKLEAKKVKSFFTGKYGMILALVCITLLFGLRIINLDQDLPPYGIAQYNPSDEGIYSTMALNMQNYGTINPDNNTNLAHGFYTGLHVRTNIIGNFLEYIGLKTFGDNYYGFRLPAVFLAALCFILIALILKEMCKKYGKHRVNEPWVAIGILFYLVLDFTLFNMSRVVETSSMRMFFGLLLIYLFFKLDNKYILKFFLAGIVVTSSVFLVYISNVFFYFACALALLFVLWKKGKKVFWKSLLFFIIGSLVTLAVCEVYYVTVWHTYALKNTLASFTEFSNTAGYTISGVTSPFSIKEIAKHFLKYFSANILLYNIPVLAWFVLTLPVSIYQVIKHKDEKIMLIASCILGFLLQTLASEDYITRKLTMVYPLFIFAGLAAYFSLHEFNSWIETHLQKSKPSKIKKVEIFYIVLTALFYMGCVTYRLFRDSNRADFTKLDKFSILFLQLIPTVIMFVWLICGIIKKTTLINKAKFKKGAIVVIACSIIFNLFMLGKYVVLNPTYTERDTMIKLGQEYNGQYIAGSYSVGFTLYNNILPIVNTGEYYNAEAENGSEIKFIDADDTNSIGVRNCIDNDVFLGSDYTLYPIEKLDRTYQLDGSKINFAIYKIIPKSEAVKLYKEKYQEYLEKSKEKDKKIAAARKLPLTRKEIDAQINKIQQEFNGVSKVIEYYPDINTNINQDILNDIYVNIHGSIYGDVRAKIYGDVYGDIYGDIYEKIEGTVYGKIYGQKKYS